MGQQIQGRHTFLKNLNNLAHLDISHNKQLTIPTEAYLLYVSSEKQQAESLWLNTLQCIYLCEDEWNDQSFGFSMTTDDAPLGDSWPILLIKLNRISEIFVGSSVQKGYPLYLDLSYSMLRETVSLQGLKRHTFKRQTDKIITSSKESSLLILL